MATDYTQLPDEDFWDEFMAINNEANRRHVRQEAPAKQNILNQEFLDAEGIVEGSDWRQPTGGHDAYPMGFKVMHNDSEWENLIPANVWEPGLDPRWWKNLTPVVDPNAWNPDAYAYAVDDEVTYLGDTYKCLQAHTSQAGWDPVTVPALWEIVTPV